MISSLRYVYAAGLMLLLLARVPDVVHAPQFWAEDGSIFFRDVWCSGAASLFTPYGGYYHLLPRLIALAASLFPLRYAPAFYCSMSLVTVFVVLLLVLSPRLHLPHRWLLALAVVMVPNDGEVFACTTGVQWFLALGLVVMVLLGPGASRWSLLTDAVFVLAAGLTGPFIVFVLPPFLFALWRQWADPRARRRLLVLAVIAVPAAALQFHTVLFTSQGKEFQSISLALCCREMVAHFTNVVQFALGRTFGYSLRGVIALLSHKSLEDVDILPIISLSFAAAGGCALLLIHDLWRNRTQSREKLLLLYIAVVFVFTTFYRNAILISYPFSSLVLVSSDRYSFVPRVMLLWLMITLIRKSWSGLAASVCVAAIFLTTVLGFQREPRPDLQWPQWSYLLAAHKVREIPINPAGWKIDLHCGDR